MWSPQPFDPHGYQQLDPLGYQQQYHQPQMEAMAMQQPMQFEQLHQQPFQQPSFHQPNLLTPEGRAEADMLYPTGVAYGGFMGIHSRDPLGEDRRVAYNPSAEPDYSNPYWAQQFVKARHNTHLRNHVIAHV
eukprot:CAMPEP_0174287148 /NCGR_PEP_ID=MMETSP0809-20121228/14584_1 /TAXON_ID=73025 ORGANISM="Eutreptiella gymnastica-like, Strain CCMP1594" /NCGR_SAMPLE_ID=MMETSP0809 /ASSEMBLY_ACC=CAM_ASM_000658 /LENGTH=131 /DNA_ID=CAMNT_0015383529 /DNA_START=20 /DNA_END=415 /DNA_ORIENTATION=+